MKIMSNYWPQVAAGGSAVVYNVLELKEDTLLFFMTIKSFACSHYILLSCAVFFQDDKDLVHEFVIAEGLACLIKVGAEADQNYQNYILRGIASLLSYYE